MGNDHGITGELREWFKDRIFMANGWQEIHDIADRIDAEHKKVVMGAMNDALNHANYSDMADLGWMRLPVDADGEVVRIGDVMVMASHPFGCEDKPLVVDRMELSRGMHGEVWCLALDTDRNCWTQAAVLRHYHAPTVEDLLREFADRVCNSGHQWGLDAADTIAEYAAKLRLAGDAE